MSIQLPVKTLPFICVCLFYVISLTGFAEGTKQVRPTSTTYGSLSIDNTYTAFATYNATANYRLYINISNYNEMILFGLHRNSNNNRSYQLKDPNGVVVKTGLCPNTVSDSGYIPNYNQAVVGPYFTSGGYHPIKYQVLSGSPLGDYYIEFSGAIDFDYFDFQVVTGINPIPIPSDGINGRVYSKSWQFYANLGPFEPFSGMFYVYSDDQITTACSYDGAHVGRFTMFCNQYGCLNTGNFSTDRQSKNNNTSGSFPGIAQYKVFLNNPDPLIYTDGVYGAMIGAPTYPYVAVDPAYPSCSGRKIIFVDVNKEGNVEILITVPYGSPGTDVHRYAVVVPGVNQILWDGLDGTGTMVPDGTLISMQITYVNGLTNLPLWDIERNPNGFTITLVRPINPLGENPKTYWDDSQLTGCPNPKTTNLTGCLPAATGCHIWESGSSGSDCHDKMINTWWYSASSSTANLTANQIVTPPPPAVTGNFDRCGPGVVNLMATVLTGEIVRWFDQATGGTLLGTSNSGTPFAQTLASTGTYNFYAEAYNPTPPYFCTSATRSLIIVHAIAIPNPPSLLSPPFYHCGNGPVTLNALPLTNIDVEWYDAPSGGNFLGSGNSFVTPFLTTTTVYYAQAVDVTYNTHCNSAARTPFSAEIIPNPSVNQVSNIAVCAGSAVSASFNGPVPGTVYNWTNSDPSIGLAASGSGNIDPFPATNPTLNPVTAIIAVTPTYSSSSGASCSGTIMTFNITVNPLPAVILPPFAPVCQNTPAFTLNSGTPAGGTYSLGGIPITIFNPATYAAGTYTITYDYTDGNGCRNTASNSIVVQSLITPNLLGNSSACKGVGEVFSTDAGMANYQWSVLPDGTITGTNPASKTITWPTIGTKSVTLTYTDPSGCTTIPAVRTIIVNPLPIPAFLSGNFNACNHKTYTYTTQPGMTAYSWNVSPGNIVTFSGNTANVTWNIISPAEWVEVNYVDGNGCTALAPTRATVIVNPTPVFTVTGPLSVCAGSTNTAYNLQGTETGNWSLSGGGSITTPANNVHSVSITWNSVTVPGSADVGVSYINLLGCPGVTTTVVSIQPLPVTSFTTTTPSPVCQDSPTPSSYTVDPGGASATYLWQANPSSSATIANPTANPASITWRLSGNSPQTVQLSLTATTSATVPACTATSNPMMITINPKPAVSMSSCFDLVTNRSAKPFLLKGGRPLLTATPLQGEYLISPATTALYTDVSGNYYFDPSLVPGTMPITYNISYKYTSSQYGCVATSATPVALLVMGPNPACGTSMTDYRDNTVYKAAMFGGRCWMTQNLRYGGSIAESTSQTDNCIVEKYCLTTDPNCTTYGGLYQWDELIQYGVTSGPAYQGVCPPGWHIPTQTEWQDLIDAVSGMNPGDGLAGSFLIDPNPVSGFHTLLDGILYLNDIWSFTSGNLTATMLWTSTVNGSLRAVARGMNSINYSTSLYPSSKANAFPLRCIKD